MSKRTFNDCYCELWELLDKPSLSFWQRMRAKQLLNQMQRKYEVFYIDMLNRPVADKRRKGTK